MNESVLVLRETLKHWLTLLDIAGDICPWGYDAAWEVYHEIKKTLGEDMTREDIAALKHQLKSCPSGRSRSWIEALLGEVLCDGIDTVQGQAKALAARDMYTALMQYSPGEEAR